MGKGWRGYGVLYNGIGDGGATGNHGWSRREVVYVGFVSWCMFVAAVVVVVLRLLLFCFLAAACWKRSTEYPLSALY